MLGKMSGFSRRPRSPPRSSRPHPLEGRAGVVSASRGFGSRSLRREIPHVQPSPQARRDRARLDAVPVLQLDLGTIFPLGIARCWPCRLRLLGMCRSYESSRSSPVCHSATLAQRRFRGTTRRAAAPVRMRETRLGQNRSPNSRNARNLTEGSSIRI
jgi:hypothetical protein